MDEEQTLSSSPAHRVGDWDGSLAAEGAKGASTFWRAVPAPRRIRLLGRPTRVVIVGSGAAARELARQIATDPSAGYEVVAFVRVDGDQQGVLPKAHGGPPTVPVIDADSLRQFAAAQSVDRIVIAADDCADALPLEVLLRCQTDGHSIEADDSFREHFLGRIAIAESSPQHLLLSGSFDRSRLTGAVKRAIDIVSAGFMFLLTAPLAFVVALVIKLEDGGPMLFRQQRVGHHGKPFIVHKFRSMRVDAEAETGPMWAQANDPRVTRIGRWLRALRIDELPQLWNVLRGDMSFVGPRPERPEFVAKLRAAMPLYDHRHAVRPGITGWAQVNLPYGSTVEDARRKLEYDLYYLKNFSLHMDWVIMLRTVKIVLFGWRKWTPTE